MLHTAFTRVLFSTPASPRANMLIEEQNNIVTSFSKYKQNL
jgi:hypothetical protein